MRRFLYPILSFITVIMFYILPAGAHPALLFDLDSGRVLAHRQAFDRWYPASLTKLMTVYLVFEAIDEGEFDFDSVIKLSALAAQQPPSRSGFPEGSLLKVDTALKILLVKSTNDLAIALAEKVSGSHQNFVALMNKTAKRLGLYGTHFTSANGLHNPANYTTARDMAVLAFRLRRDFPRYAFYFNFPAIDFGNGHQLVLNSNNLINRFRGIDGMKTGFLCASGYNLVASATRAHRTLIAVVLGAPSTEAREIEAAQLLENGFQGQFSENGPALLRLKPYGHHLTKAMNLRKNVCSVSAWKKNTPKTDKNGAIIIHSPLVAPFKLPKRIIHIQFVPSLN